MTRRKKAKSALAAGDSISNPDHTASTDLSPGLSDGSVEQLPTIPIGTMPSDETPDGVDEGDSEAQSNEGVSIEKADRSLAELHRWYRRPANHRP